MSGKLFKELECPDYLVVNQEILSWIELQPGLEISDKFWNPVDTVSLLSACPRFLEWCKSHNIAIKSIAVTVGKDPSCCSAHTDTPPARFKLSWPVKNTRDTWNCWYEVITDSPDVQVNSLGGVMYTNLQDLREIYRREVTGPALIDTSIVHDVTAGPAAQWPRIGLQCQLFKEPSEL